MLRNGITGVADDFIHVSLGREDVEAVLTAYRDSGMRARVSMMVEDSPWRRSIPYVGPDPTMQTRLDAVKDEPAKALASYRGLLDPSARDRRIGLMVSPSAPQRCSPRFLRDLVELARTEDLPFHVHIQETLAQCVAGPKLFSGRSMIAFMADEGLLGPETTIAHAIWIDDDDIARIADNGASVVHNPVSNLKAPFRGGTCPRLTKCRCERESRHRRAYLQRRSRFVRGQQVRCNAQLHREYRPRHLAPAGRGA